MQTEIYEAVRISGLGSFTGKFQALGGGEVNDSFLLDCGVQKYILRITRRVGRDTLIKEASALKFLDMPQAPKVIFFDPLQTINGRFWIIESFLPGQTKTRLSVDEFRQLGEIFGKVHAIHDPDAEQLDLRKHFLVSCRSFGTEEDFLNHENERLRKLILWVYEAMRSMQPTVNNIQTALVHGDATPSNILIDDGKVYLIDWEFARFSDPMMEFSTIYYEDMEFNCGKWRVQIRPDEKAALFEGYSAGGGVIDEDRIAFWMAIDKLGAAVYLYWRIHLSGEAISDDQLQQYQLDLENLLVSLERAAKLQL